MPSFELNRLYIPENIEAVIFDFDNTLVDCITPKVPQHKHTAAQLGIELSDEEILQNWSIHSFSGLLRTLYGEHAAQANKLIIEQYDQFPKDLYLDTIETLQALGDAGLHLALMTSLREDRLEKDFEATGIDPNIFEYIQTEKDTTVHKPNGAVFNPTKRWLSSIGVQNARDALYMGDALEDMQAASAAGFGFVGIERGFVKRKQFEDAGVLCISSLAELLIRRNS